MEDGVRRIVSSLIVPVTLAGWFAYMAPLAHTMEPRPWLCRDKPAVSDNQPMTYTIENRGAGRWVMTFMRFDPATGHDGFEVVSTQDVIGHVEGTLDPGQWYAVGLYREGDHWICAGPASENQQYVKGVVRDLCYGEDAGSCDVKLTVREASPGH
jgi:hypothetical protein